jgi:hypothetical protein
MTPNQGLPDAQVAVNEWLASIPRLPGDAPLRLGEEGACRLDYDHQVSLWLGLSPDGSSLHVEATVAEVAEADALVSYQKALEANRLGMKTRGAFFAWDGENRQLVLSFVMPVAALDAHAFRLALGNLIEMVIEWRPIFRHLACPDGVSSGSEAGPAMPSPFRV